ncbi:hypothetical protein Tco_1492190 [Tanacetum coccineum]
MKVEEAKDGTPNVVRQESPEPIKEEEKPIRVSATIKTKVRLYTISSQWLIESPGNKDLQVVSTTPQLSKSPAQKLYFLSQLLFQNNTNCYSGLADEIAITADIRIKIKNSTRRTGNGQDDGKMHVHLIRRKLMFSICQQYCILPGSCKLKGSKEEAAGSKQRLRFPNHETEKESFDDY